MATKENYQDAIMRMYDFCIASNHSAQIKEQFTQDLDFLAKLANEHFEKKAETNYEHYKDGILQNVKYALAVVNGEPKSCIDTNCGKCDFKGNSECVKRVREWLNQPYKKPTYKLSQFEYDLLRTNNMSRNRKLSSFATYKNLGEIGYFKDIDFDLTINEILSNFEVKDRNEVKND